MSEKKPFDAVIGLLRELLKDELKILVPSDHPKLEVAIRILKDWPKWEPLIEVAGKADKEDAIHTLSLLAENWYETSGAYGEGPDAKSNEIMRPSAERIRALLESLPEKEKR